MSEPDGEGDAGGHEAAGAAEAPSWFSDETSLLSEVRRAVVSFGDAPRVPGYTSLVRLKAGGQAVVYGAMQASTGRRVAIKVVRADDERARARFAREIELAASLRHPHIVRVYDSGVTDGRVYLVMELIEGPSLERFADGMGPRRVAALVATVAEAVGYAHQRGVIHRDLKPDNILIDSEGQPRVVDFGLARADPGWSQGDGEGGPDGGRSVTQEGQFVGSVAWSSPEHSSGNPDAVDTRSDVYSLGVILYRLLTGQMPYDTSGSLSAAFANIAGADPGPMARSASGEGIDQDLRTIALTCLRKDPGRRYGTAAELARDLRNYLGGEPIEAQRESAWRAMNRRARRFRAVLTVTAVGLVAISGLLVWSLVEASRARVATGEALTAKSAAEAARTEAEKAKALAEQHQGEAEAARVEAEQSRALAERREKQAGRVAQFLTTMLRSVDSSRLKKDAGGRDVKVVEVLEKAAEQIPRRFADDHVIAASLHGAIGQSYRSLGQIDDAEKQFDEGLRHARLTGDEQIICDALWNRAALIGNTRGRSAEAEPLMREVAALREKLKGPDDRATLEARDAWASQLQGLGKFDEAGVLFKETLERRGRKLPDSDGDMVTSLNNYGTFLRATGQPEAALPYLKRSAEGAEKGLGPEHPSALIAWGNYANTLVRLDRADEAVPILERVVAGQLKINGPNHQHTAGAMNQLAGALEYTTPARKEEAVARFREAIAAAERSVGASSRATIAYRNNLAQCLSEMGRYDEAVAEQRIAVEAIEKVRGPDHYDTHAMRGNLGKILLDAGRYNEAEPLILAAYEGLAKAYSPAHPEAISRAQDLASLYRKMGRADEAAKWEERSKPR
ncbi:MAG: serine/threonine-protein kinase [Phycisphaerales bacterium]|nr:serine/threonine-protein kinase [Phycisphaerales bacterium]